MPSRPTRLKVNHHVYRIKWGQIDPKGEDAYFYGRTHPRETSMEIDPTNSASQVRDTLLHEALHAVLADAPHGLDTEDEEALVRILSPVLLQVLRSNPQFVKFLLEA